MTVSEKLLKYNERRAEVQKQLDAARVLVKDAFNEGAQDLLNSVDGLRSFSWTQYTPYFNDGEACVFGVRSDYPEVNGSNEYGETAGYDEEEYEEAPKYGTPEYDVWKKEKQKLIEPVRKFLAMFSDDDMHWLFGDHVKITVTSAGTNTKEYDHD